MDILQKNKIIAEFMTDEPEVLAKDLKKAGTLESMQYHSDWTWLMEVVKRIESITIKETIEDSGDEIDASLTVIIEGGFCQISSNGFYVNEIISTHGEKKECVYEAVFEFVKWYNENQK